MNSCSLLIATYNWPEALELCLKSVLQQKIFPGEVVIADDGSTEETKEVIQKFQDDFPVPLIHIWQPDEGFQLARIRNKGIAVCAHDYIVQIDGDLILHPYFIHDHLELRKEGYFTTGSRVLLSPSVTQRLFRSKCIDAGRYSSSNRNLLNSVRSNWLRKRMAPIYKTGGKNLFYVKGCNMAFWKADLLKVNGYNESFSGWGKEDSEIAIRLMNAGIKKQFLKMGGICYHLYHNEASRELERRNSQMMQDAIDQKIVWAEKGLDQYLPANHH